MLEQEQFAGTRQIARNETGLILLLWKRGRPRQGPVSLLPVYFSNHFWQTFEACFPDYLLTISWLFCWLLTVLTVSWLFQQLEASRIFTNAWLSII